MTMLLLHTISDTREAVGEARRGGSLIGLAPTMGALHAGHAALIRQARAECGFVVVSIFVNPTQFDRSDDYEHYPRTVGTDMALCRELSVDAVFAPAASEIYAEAPLTSVDVAEVSAPLCGAFRPGHFRGVASVVAKLFNIVQPDRAYFGEKDAQQLAVIQRMASDLNFPVTIVPVATVRERDGLALSSRNQRLSARERSTAPLLYRALQTAAAALESGHSVAEAKEPAMAMLGAEPAFRVEYFEVVDARTMQPVGEVRADVRIATAAWLGVTRLIDNVPVRARDWE